MDEFLAYSLTDLLMFTPQIYMRLFNLYNSALWPVHIPVAAMTLWLSVATREADALRARLISLLLATAWAVIAWLFFMHHYATIQLAAPWFAAGFALQAMLLLVIGVIKGRLHYAWHASHRGRAGLLLFLIAVAILPLVALASGEVWRHAEMFGLTPDPTALGTIGLMLMARGRLRAWLLPLPLLWCAISFLTYLAMVSKGS